jgi:lipopolysaccharide export system protein LptC
MSINTRSAAIFPITLLAVLAMITAWINYSVQSQAPSLDGSSRHDPDYIVSHFVTKQTDVDGNLSYRLAAAEMKHFPDNDQTDLISPHFTQYAIGKPYTSAQGLYGKVSSNGQQIQLTKQVKITRQAFAEKGEMTLETEYLDILPDENIVKTDLPVVIRQAPKTVIYATGMVYDKNIKTMTLLHKVRAHYEKPLMQKKSVKK